MARRNTPDLLAGLSTAGNNSSDDLIDELVGGHTMLKLASIRQDGGTQPREALSPDVIDEYTEALDNSAQFPPVLVYHDGQNYWLADGFHRFAAHARAGRAEIAAAIRQGTQRDAILASVSANADHGLRRSPEDKRRAVLRLLEDTEWSQWSDREIARRCHVSPTFVGGLRKIHTVHVDSMETQERTYIHPKTGQPATMQTANIGQRPDPEFRPIPPVGYQEWDGKKCPQCGSDTERMWHPSQWQADDARRLQEEINDLEEEWVQAGRHGLRPTGNHPKWIQLRDHWSRFTPGECMLCGAQFWHDYVIPRRYWAQDVTAENTRLARPEYVVPIYEIEREIRAWLSGFLDPNPDQVLASLNEQRTQSAYWTDLADAISQYSQHARQRDIYQALANLAEQARQVAAKNAADEARATALPIITEELVRGLTDGDPVIWRLLCASINSGPSMSFSSLPLSACREYLATYIIQRQYLLGRSDTIAAWKKTQARFDPQPEPAPAIEGTSHG